MKRRHAAALALVGWYLMLPPVQPTGVHPFQPLSEWIRYQDYDSFPPCLAAEGELHRRGEQDPSVTPTLEFPPRQLQQFAAARCIASDDPQLKPK